MGVGGPHSVVGLYNNGIADFGNELFTAFKRFDKTVSRRGHTRLCIVLFHLRLVLYFFNVFKTEPRIYIKLGTEQSVAFKPIFVVAFKEFYLAVLEDKECDGAVYFFVIFKAGHAVIFVYGITHFVGKIFIGTIAYAENVEAVLL